MDRSFSAWKLESLLTVINRKATSSFKRFNFTSSNLFCLNTLNPYLKHNTIIQRSFLVQKLYENRMKKKDFAVIFLELKSETVQRTLTDG